MTIADKLKREGKQEDIRLIVRNAMIKKMSLEDIIEITGLTEEEIDQISEGMLQ